MNTENILPSHVIIDHHLLILYYNVYDHSLDSNSLYNPFSDGCCL